MKPVWPEELFQILMRAKERLWRQRREGLVIQNRNSVYFVPFTAIRYLESNGRQIRCVADGGVYERYGRLHEIAERLDGRFFQCHKSFIVNLDYVIAFEPSRFRLRTGEEIPVSARRRAEARERFLQSLKAEFHKYGSAPKREQVLPFQKKQDLFPL